MDTPRTDALTDVEVDMDGARLLVRYDQLARLARELEAECAQRRKANAIETQIAIEYGYRCCEKGMNLQQTLSEALAQ